MQRIDCPACGKIRLAPEGWEFIVCPDCLEAEKVKQMREKIKDALDEYLEEE